MSRKITQEEFLKRFYQSFPQAKVEVLEYDSLKKPCRLKCLKCGKELYQRRAEYFCKNWGCCEGKNESKIELIKRLCSENGHYEFIKQTDTLHVIIKHLDCGMEQKRTIQSATAHPCSCQNCNTRSSRLRLIFEQAKQKVEVAFEGNIELLFFDGVDSKKSQFRCRKCGLIFNQALDNFTSKCRGCPKCDQRRSKGERSMRRFLDERGIKYNEQVRVPELGKLSFDFEIWGEDGNRICFIEIQGDQHYREVFRYHSRPDYFKTQQQHDEEKRQWCKANNLPLYEIYNNCGILENLDILDNLNSTTISAKESKA